MTDQEAFDIVVKHLLTQKERSSDAKYPYTCAYRGKGGTKCAIGALIPDDVYKVEMENVQVYELMAKLEDYGLAFLKDVDVALLEDLQRVHDFELVAMWGEELRAVANKFGLEFNPPEDLTAAV